jgi:flagellar biosynthesis/type III secretory pathway M-ring protein FliF/YscJ
VKLGQLLGLCVPGLILGILIYLIPLLGIVITGLLVIWIIVAKYPQPTRTPSKEKEKPSEPTQHSEEEKDQTQELIQEDSEGDGLMTMSNDDILFPPEDFDEDE